MKGAVGSSLLNSSPVAQPSWLSGKRAIYSLPTIGLNDDSRRSARAWRNTKAPEASLLTGLSSASYHAVAKALISSSVKGFVALAVLFMFCSISHPRYRLSALHQ